MACQLKLIWWDEEKKQERHRERKRKQTEEHKVLVRRQSSALSSRLSIDLTEFVLTAQKRLRQHLPICLHTNTHLLQERPRQRRERANEGVSESE